MSRALAERNLYELPRKVTGIADAGFGHFCRLRKLPAACGGREAPLTRPALVLALLLVGALAAADEQPKLLPTRDVEISYDVTRPQKPKVRERVRWLAAEHLERVDASGRATTILTTRPMRLRLLTPATRTFRKLDQAPRRPLEPEPGPRLSAAPRRSSGITLHRLVLDGGRGKAHRLRHRRRRRPAFDRRRTNLHRGAFSKVRPAESRPLPRARQLHARARS